MKVFYSWQSDLENTYNRGVIKKALEKAIKELNVDLEIGDADRQIQLDHDTKNVPGTPDLAGKIFEKIAASTVFIADISFVAERTSPNTGESRKVANPNVLIELGYALAKLGSDRVLCVFNKAFGSVDNLPFDLKNRRHPIQYHLDKSSKDVQRQKADLSNTLRNAIKSIVELDIHKSTECILPLNPSREDVIQTLLDSDPIDDWETTGSVGNTEIQTTFYKKNMNLRFELGFGNESVHCENFIEPWANKYPNRAATSHFHRLYFGSTHIADFILVTVDGGRASLPLPNNSTDLTVSPLNYKIAQIHETQSTLDQYMAHSELKVEKSF